MSKDNKEGLLGLIKPASTPATINTKRYKYATGRKIISAYTIDPELVDKIERMAYHDRMGKSEIVNTILKDYFKGRDFDDIPDKHKNVKKAR